MRGLKPAIARSALRRYNCQSCACFLQTRRHFTATAPETPEIFDVVCVGGGPAGLSLLTALRALGSTSNLKVALIESQDLGRTRTWNLPPDQYSNRVSSLTPSSVAFLEGIGAWRHIQSSRVQSYHEMQVWDGVSGSRISFDWPGTGSVSRSSQDKTIAYMTENLNLTSALLARLEELGGLTVLDNTRVNDIHLGEETETLNLSLWPVVEVAGGRRLAARLLVGADGANSPVRTFAGIKSRGWDYERHGLVATVRLEGECWGGTNEKVAYQRFLPTGPVALLPLPGGFSTLVWSTLPSHAALLKSLSPTDFIAMVNAAFRLSPVDLNYMHTQHQGQAEELSWREQHTRFDVQRIPQRIVGVQEGTITSFPLKMRHADTYIGERVALVGDAAHTVHPLAGQGLNQGQGDVQSLAKTIEYAVTHGQDIGTQLSLEPYVADRYATNNLLLGIVDKLHKLYGVQSGPVVALRSWGLQAVDAMGGLKGFLMRQAAGGS
ncbi:MAG: putative ubiquinone biosynthesis monooxygenase [Geoglossum simile]|nr:MAG: putative ubiquinone biosynthesis monooxygenase [Geoglossum simile]